MQCLNGTFHIALEYCTVFVHVSTFGLKTYCNLLKIGSRTTELGSSIKLLLGAFLSWRSTTVVSVGKKEVKADVCITWLS